MTVIVKVVGIPGHPLNVGVTIIVPEMLVLVVFVATNEAIVALVPDVDKPIAELEFVHE